MEENMISDLRLIEMFSTLKRPIVFLDFDGTISKKDVIDQILERFADDEWLEIEEMWLDGKIGSRVCLQKQFALVKATPDELDGFIDSLELDEGFLNVVRFCERANIKVHIISDGFDYYIRRMLSKAFGDVEYIAEIEIYANSLKPISKNSWETDFPYFETVCGDGCATCKPAVMRLKNPLNQSPIFVGDGLSDRFAAQSADVVFAKKKLAEFCDQNRIPHIKYFNLEQVAESLSDAFEPVLVPIFQIADRTEQAGIYMEINESFI